MHKLKFILISLFFASQLFVSGQHSSFGLTGSRLSTEQKLDSLMVLHKKLNAINNSIPGYRVQIYFESGNYSKSKANEVKNSFEQKYTGLTAYISFNEPYYRVRVGDFRTKIEAIGFLKKILRDYPSAYEVKDMITLKIN